MLLQWLDVFKAGQSCTLHRSLLLRAFIPRCVTLWVSSARTHEETRLRAFSLKDTSAARFSFFFLYCHFSDIHTLQVRFNVAPLCAKHSPNYLDSLSFFLFLFFWSCIYQWPEGVRKVVHFLSGPAHSYLQFKPRPPPSTDEYSGWGDYWGQRAFFFFSPSHTYTRLPPAAAAAGEGSSDALTLRSYIYAFLKDTFEERSVLKGFSYIPIIVFTHFDNFCITLNSQYHENPVLLSDFLYDSISEPPATV